MLKIIHIVGARPQFIKVAPVINALNMFNSRRRVVFLSRIVHTGQHYDKNMSGVFFKELSIPKPDYNLGIGSSTHGEQTAGMIQALEKVLLHEKPDYVFLYGDTNSTLAGAIAASKIHYPQDFRIKRPFIAHIEAGLRSFDKLIPEEINRILTDHVSDLLFCPTKTAVTNLKREGITKGVYLSGDVMCDSLLSNSALIKGMDGLFLKFGVKGKDYLLLTVHRQENTDIRRNLQEILSAVGSLNTRVIFPVHPRTKKAIGGLGSDYKNIIFTDPFSYLEMLFIEKNAKIIITDSGGVQKEAYLLGVPCVTLRNSTEWVETVQSGWNILTGVDNKRIRRAIVRFSKPIKRKRSHIYGMGKSALKIAQLTYREVRNNGG